MDCTSNFSLLDCKNIGRHVGYDNALQEACGTTTKGVSPIGLWRVRTITFHIVTFIISRYKKYVSGRSFNSILIRTIHSCIIG